MNTKYEIPCSPVLPNYMGEDAIFYSTTLDFIPRRTLPIEGWERVNALTSSKEAAGVSERISHAYVLAVVGKVEVVEVEGKLVKEQPYVGMRFDKTSLGLTCRVEITSIFQYEGEKWVTFAEYLSGNESKPDMKAMELTRFQSYLTYPKVKEPTTFKRRFVPLNGWSRPSFDPYGLRPVTD